MYKKLYQILDGEKLELDRRLDIKMHSFIENLVNLNERQIRANLETSESAEEIIIMSLYLEMCA